MKSLYIYAIYICVYVFYSCRKLNHLGQKSQSETLSRPASELRGEHYKSSSLFFNVNTLLLQMVTLRKLDKLSELSVVSE